jgi:phosphoribosyl 1,2-cyclic phosphate phosphodiesterase
VDRGAQLAFVYVFEKAGRKVVYSPCDFKPFPEHRNEVQQANLLIIQPGIFEEGLKHGFRYPANHISRTTLYTFEQTMDLATRLQAERVLFVHLEEYWNRSHDDYHALETSDQRVRFAFDGMQLTV